MGSCLGLTFADFFICNFENKIFSEHPEQKPRLYARYINDIFLVVNNVEELKQIRAKFQSDSILNFTHEVEKDNQLSFLECLVRNLNNSFQTSGYVKVAHNGDCLNYENICSHSYKRGVIKTLHHLGKRVWSYEQIFQEEVKRIKQLLVDNNFPMKLMDDLVAKFT